MTQFVKKGEMVNMATFIIKTKRIISVIISTNGSEAVKKL